MPGRSFSTYAWTSPSTTEEYLQETSLPSVDVVTPYQSTWLDNAKAKFLLDWKPQIDLKQLIDKAWDFQRAADDPRKVWYPG